MRSRRSGFGAFAAAAIIAVAVALFCLPAAWADDRGGKGGGLSAVPQPFVETGMHGAAINALAPVRDGQLASVSDDKTLRLWNLATGDLNATLRVPVAPGTEGALHALAVSPSGGFVAIGGSTGFAADGSANIYVFNVEKRTWAGRITLDQPLSDTINDLAFSPDAKWLAVATNDSRGLRVVDMKARTTRLIDADYRDAVTRVAFSADGHLAAAALDGSVRLYGPDMTRIATYRAPDGLRPFDVAFSPDGARLAVSFLRGSRVALLGGHDLKVEGFLDGAPGRSGQLSVVAWAADGSTLFATGTYGDGGGRKLVRRWPLAGGPASDIAVSDDTVLALAPLPAGGIAYGTGDPAWGVIGADGAISVHRERATADFRDQVDGGFAVGPDGTSIRFGLDRGGARPRLFDLIAGDYRPDAGAAPPAPAALARLKDWRNGTAPRLDGIVLPLETDEISRSAAVIGAGGRVVLGTDFGLKLFEKGKLLWKTDLPSAVWAVGVAEAAGWVVAGLGDGTIRWFDLETGRQALSFFPHADGARWLVSTPEGFFDHGKDSEHLFGYVVNTLADGKPKGADWVSIDQVYSLFYRRDLVVAKLRRTGESEIAMAAARIGGVSAVVNRGLPPLIALTEICAVASDGTETCQPAPQDRGTPGGAVTVTSTSLRLKYKSTDQGGGIGRVLVRLNGAVVEGGKGASVTSAGSQDASRLISLGQGTAEIRLSAFNAANEIEVDRDRQPVVLLTTAPAPPSPIATAEGETRPILPATPIAPTAVGDPSVAGGRIHVLAIGVNRFTTPEIPPLVNAVADAGGMIEALAGPATVSVLLTDEKATRAAILAALDQLASDVGPDDTAVIFLAGHGVPIEGRYYYLPHDLSAKTRAAIQAEGISQDDIISGLGRLRAWRAAVVLDTCFAGLLAVEDAVMRQTANDTVAGQLVRASGRFILAGAASKEEALDGVNGHGVFTGTLIEGLSGQADEKVRGNNDRIVDVFEIGEYAKTEVPAIARRISAGHRQSPRWFFTGSDLFPLTRVGNGG